MDEDDKKKKAILFAQSSKKYLFEKIRIADLLFYSKVISLTFGLLTIIATLYYGYLNSLYLIDEVYEGTSLRELDLVEKMTIVVAAHTTTTTDKLLKKFVESYSLCQAVHEIVIVWNGHMDPFPDDSYFKFSKTHSKVKFTNIILPDGLSDSESLVPPTYAQYFYPSKSIDTNAVIFLDLDVMVSCDHLAFTHNVWRSASDSIVGYFPRLHRYFVFAI